MGRTLIILLLSLGVVSCGDSFPGMEEETEIVSETSKVQILLNEGKNDQALALIEIQLAANPGDPDLLFYKASAYSSKANINIYSLYPILEMKLFKRPATDWSESSSERNPYAGYLESYFKLQSEEEMTLLLGAQNMQDENEFESPENGDLEKIEDEISATNEKRRKFVTQTLDLIWGIYESLPIITLAPQLNSQQVNFAHQALLTLLEIPSGTSIQKKVKLFRSLISSILFLNRIKMAIPLDQIKNTHSLLCQTDVGNILEDLGHSIKYLEIFLVDLHDLKFKNADFEKYYATLGAINKLNQSEIAFLAREFQEKIQQQFCLNSAQD